VAFSVVCLGEGYVIRIKERENERKVDIYPMRLHSLMHIDAASLISAAASIDT
jgi:hypothetical protein